MEALAKFIKERACHSERSEESCIFRELRSFTWFRMTKSLRLTLIGWKPVLPLCQGLGEGFGSAVSRGNKDKGKKADDGDRQVYSSPFPLFTFFPSFSFPCPLPQHSQPPMISLVPTQLTMKVSGKFRASWVRALKPVQWPARMTSGCSSFKPTMVSLMS
jgi:hypothetical protein